MTTESRLTGLETCPLDKATPFGITDVRSSQFSIARFSGACVFNGARYTYFPKTDELVRDDVLRWQRKQKREVKK